MQSTIGETAGKVWNYLNEHGDASLTSLAENIDGTRSEICMAVGWLACEEKLDYQDSGRGTRIHLQ